MKTPGTFFLKRNQIGLGIALGILLPVLVFFLVFKLRFGGLAFDEFLNYFRHERSLVTFFGVWCLVGNIAIFTFYINTDRHRTAWGIFWVTVVYGVGLLLVKALM